MVGKQKDVCPPYLAYELRLTIYQSDICGLRVRCPPFFAVGKTKKRFAHPTQQAHFIYIQFGTRE